jgi:beta-xylosidase
MPLDMEDPVTGMTKDFTTPTHPWTHDQGDGTYRNPIICADYSDPDVIRDGDDFFLVASSFNCTPGLPVLHSRDLVNWTIINRAIKNLPHPRYAQVQHGQGVWAPSIRKHAGRFWIFFPTPDEGIFLTTADHPAHRWSEPHLVQPGRGLIDPCPLWDDDGRAYLVHAWAHSRSGIKHRLDVRPMAPDGSTLLGDGRSVFNAPDRHPTLEGPKFHKRNGYYYISAPAGGVATGWQLILRSRHVYGPYDEKVVLEQGSTPINGPHQGAIVEVASGDPWFVHFQDADPYGRIVHLQPVRWVDGMR